MGLTDCSMVHLVIPIFNIDLEMSQMNFYITLTVGVICLFAYLYVGLYKRLIFREAEANLNNPNYCQPCKKHRTYNTNQKYFECPKCGVRHYPPSPNKTGVLSRGIDN